jgi:hypothetical protein
VTGDWIDELGWTPDGPPWLAMGLSRLDESRWLLSDERRSAELAQRARLVRDRRDEVFGALVGTERAGAEVLDLVQAWLATHGSAQHGVDDVAGPVDPQEHPLLAAGRLVQEDLVLMVPRDGAHHLDAAVLCFPSHWRLRDKLGGSAAAIHGPVPRYAEELAAKVDRFLDRLRPGVIAGRRNWTVHPDDALFAPEPPDETVPVSVEQVADELWLRSERQTLRRLPESGAVLFTIRVQHEPFGVLARHREAAGTLAARLRNQPRALTEMNGLGPHLPAVLTWLDEVAADDRP